MRVVKPGVLAGPVDATIDLAGASISARTGESLAAALIANGVYSCRTTRAGDRRGVFCGMGVCTECAMTIDGVSGRLACMEKVHEGLAVLPGEPFRELGGANAAQPIPPDEAVVTDVLVVGAGPAGLQAALSSRRAGASVVVVDERPAAGGQYYKQPAMPVDEMAIDRQYAAGRRLLAAADTEGVRVLGGARVWGHDGQSLLYATSATSQYEIRCRALILATGAFERGVPFPGWTLPGVMTTGAAQTLLRSYLVAAGRRVLIAGNGPLNIQVAAELTEAGVDVVAVIELARLRRPKNAAALAKMVLADRRRTADGARYLRVLRRAKVPLLSGRAVIEARGEGGEHLREVTIAAVDSAGRPVRSKSRRFEVDALCLGYGFVPSTELSRSLGCEHALDERRGVVIVRRSRSGQTTIPGVWVVGDGAEIAGADVAQASGSVAGLDAASALGLDIAAASQIEERRATRKLRAQKRFQRALWALYAAPVLTDQLANADTVICRCEEVTLAQLNNAATPWLGASGAIKRVTRAGMGKCQGRYCAPVVTKLAAQASSVVPSATSGFLPQVPIVPVPVRAAASAGDE